MKLDQAGWISAAEKKASSNFNVRPQGMPIDLLVIHCISLPEGQFGTGHAHDLFLNRLDHNAHPDFHKLRDVKVSAHFVIDRAGELAQFVSVHDRAWHAGESVFKGRAGCNDFSIGIELEGDVHTPFDAAQYHTLAQLSRVIMHSFPRIVPDHIVGHCDIAPDRKQDPGPHFDWAHYRGLIAGLETRI